ncbi:MAG: adenine phosphoribosyltransferase [Patescibacteria group bacterium]
MALDEELKVIIRSIPDWPKKGIIFRDITPLLKNQAAFKKAADWLAEPYLNKGITTVVGIDARGFILASAAAYKIGAGLVLIRKKGKLPHKTISREYTLEYATNTLEIHEDSISRGEKVLLVDDLLATGGSMEATIHLVEKLGGNIAGISFLVELTDLNGRNKLGRHPINSLIKFKEDEK